ncbi:MAG: methyltransferase domain-containing protein [Alphaproteobacteria bacterium]
MHKTPTAIARNPGNVCPRRKPLGRRVNDFINGQAANPRGLFADLLAAIWRRDHAAINGTTIDLLDLTSGMSAVDVGCGPGDALREIARRGCRALGLDVSQRMVEIARRSHMAGVLAGSIDVRRISDGDLGLSPLSIDRAMSVHSIYFWRTPERVFADLAAALKPGGRLVLAFTPEGPDVPARLRTAAYRFYSEQEIERFFSGAGFVNVHTARAPDISPSVAWVVGDKP